MMASNESSPPLSFAFRERSIPVTYHPSLTEDLAKLALESEPFQTWRQRCEQIHNHKRIEIHSVEIQSVDLFGKKVGFIKIKSHCTLIDGDTHHKEHPLPGICFLRGNAVSILVVLCCEDSDETYALLVEQPRIPIGQVSVLELPAGMIDLASDGVAGVAAKEMEEECGIVVKASELVNLTELASVRVGQLPFAGVCSSPGGSDECLGLMYLEKKVTKQQLDEMQGRLSGLREEGELITLRVVPLESIWKVSGDAKAMCSLFLLEQLRKDGKLPKQGDLATPLSVTLIPSLRMTNGADIPQLSFGLYKVPASDEGETIILNAIKAGYRHFDTASFYGNESTLGRALRKSGIPRNEFFICSKVWNDAQKQGRRAVRESVEQGLAALDYGGYFDCYLVHWPVADVYVETYKELELLYAEGKLRALGLSNFNQDEYDHLIQSGITVLPVLNQIEVSPVMYRPDLIRFFQKQNVLVSAFKPLNRGNAFEETSILQLAAARGVTPAQIFLRWGLQKGLIVVSKTATPSRMKENLNILGFVLTDDEVSQLDSLTTAEDIRKRTEHEAKSKTAL